MDSLSHSKRKIYPLQIIQWEGWFIKLYGISQHGQSVSPTLIYEAIRWIKNIFPLPATNDDRYGYGFVVIHEADLFDQIIFDWWERTNELRHHVIRSMKDGNGFEDITHTGEAFCVWELKIIGFERDTWVKVLEKEISMKDWLLKNIDGYF